MKMAAISLRIVPEITKEGEKERGVKQVLLLLCKV